MGGRRQILFISLAAGFVCVLNLWLGFAHHPGSQQETARQPVAVATVSPISTTESAAATERKPQESEPSIGSNVTRNLIPLEERNPADLSDVERVKRMLPRQPPPLKSIVDGWNITGDPSWLLDFAILGFPKCGTSSLMFHLQSHPEVLIGNDERCELGSNQHAVLMRDLYNDYVTPYATQYRELKRGIKCPAGLENTALGMPNFQKHFPHTDYIVGVRHPVLWFESFYNFRVHNLFPILPPEQLAGVCTKGSFNVCAFRANFHLFLANLGLTNLTTALRNAHFKLDQIDQHDTYIQGQLQHFPNYLWKRMDRYLPRTTRRVFFYEVSQLSDPDPTRSDAFLTDLQKFLHLTIPLDPVIWFKPGKKHSEDVLAKVSKNKIDICAVNDDGKPKFGELRSVLMESSKNAARWIRDYFVDAPGVVVSSKEYLINEILGRQWERDPCLDRYQAQRVQQL